MPDFALEAALEGFVVGIDEVGRGPLAGPVIAAAVYLDPALRYDGLDDSKRLTAKRREALAARLEQTALIGLGRAEVEEIDRINILQATFLAMRRAFDALVLRAGHPVDHALIDGPHCPKLPCLAHPVVGGDGRSLSIAAASVVAKVHRDALMATLAAEFPGFGWERNAGYGTAAHLDGLNRLGPTPHHRRSFAPVARLCARDE
ncbi:ribonuclease HII [Magnetospirillum molischianum]|uniref:Ribonuclease HII n=1 Tax=Magnetospirillum molischianum DSM 120 TaxID=1150626 RepID=H8FSI9_MAGML|nr:ribonuclease HII [Magnetospirillum molischianum]CCG41327.1 Ribonuclease HII [Magnetospirillum molischianum DSM 120]